MTQNGSPHHAAAPVGKHASTVQQVEIVHTTLTGLALIAVVFLTGLLLPLFGLNPLSSPLVAGIITIVAWIGIGTLYLLNLRAHKQVVEQARLTDVLINSLGQGFLSFDGKGVCGQVYSEACHALLKVDAVAGKNIADLLGVPTETRKDFFEWIDVLFMPDHAMGFDDAVRFLPDGLNHPDGRSVMLAYRPIRGRDGFLSRIVLIATDKTEEIEAQKRAGAERLFAAMICAIFAERQSFALTMAEMKILIDRLSRPDAAILSSDFFRDVHTMKGAAMHFKMETLGHRLHELENTLRMAEGTPFDEVKEPLCQHRAEIQLEFGRIQNALRDILGEDGEAQGLIEVDEESLYQFGKLLKQQNVSPDIYFAFQNTLLAVPLFSLLKSLDRQIQPLAEKLEKKVRPIVFSGESIRLPARPLQHFMLSLTHVVHNILDHGIETPITRMAKGKDAFGRVEINIRRTKTDDGRKWVQISIIDDGAGIDPNRVRGKLALSDPNGQWREQNDREVIQQLLTQELSTKDEVSMLSGRGAGMSAIYQEILKLGGQAELVSEMHKGTQLVIRLPEILEGFRE